MAGTLAGAIVLGGVARAEDSPSVERMKVFISTAVDQAVGEMLPPGVGEMLAVLQNSPEIVKGGLQVWLNMKRTEAAAAAMVAEQDQDIAKSKLMWEKVDRYQAFFDCLATGNCNQVKQLTASGSWAGGSTGGSVSPATFNDPRTDSGKYVDRCYAFASGCDDNDNPDPAAKPAATEFCKRKGFRAVTRGGSHWSYKAPTEILSTGESCTDPQGCGGLDFVNCQ